MEGEEQENLAGSQGLTHALFERLIFGSVSKEILFLDFLPSRFCCPRVSGFVVLFADS